MPTWPASVSTTPQSAVTPPCSASTIPVLPHHCALSPAPAAAARKTRATENEVRPPTGLVAVRRWVPLKRTALPPAGVTLRRKTGCCPTAALAVNLLLTVLQVPTASPSFKV